MNFRVPLISVGFLALLLRANADERASVTGAKITEAGIYSARAIKSFDTPGVVGGTNEGIDSFVLVQATTNVPARIGTRFGFRYTIQGAQTNALMVLTM